MDTEQPAGVQDPPEGGRGPVLLTQPADSGCTVEPRIFTVVLGRLGQDLPSPGHQPGAWPQRHATQTCLPRALPSIAVITAIMNILL